MKRFAALFEALDATTRTSVRTEALAAYFREAPEPDRLWCIALLSGRRPRRAVTATDLRTWAAARAGLPDWLFEDSYAVVGDLAETIALVLPDAQTAPPEDAGSDTGTLTDWIGRIVALARADPPARRAAVEAAWDSLRGTERFVFNKLITGGFRMGVARGLMQRALAQATGRPEAEIAHRLMGGWDPATTSFRALVLERDAGADLSRPYPFALAHALEEGPAILGDPADWLAEWKWDGIRGQLVRRGGQSFLWSRGEDLVTDRFPEIAEAAAALPDGTVLDGEILGWAGGAPLPFAALQRRIGRKTVGPKLRAQVPVAFLAYDLLEHDGRDLRAAPLSARRAALAGLIDAAPAPGLLPEGMQAALHLSPALESGGGDWPALARARAAARDAGAEGLMLKRLSAGYHAGRKRGDWWKWKLDPRSIDAVMIYAQAGHGRRATLFTDYTFALWDGDALVPVAKAYSGLSDAEFREITAWVRKHTLERFGPVRRVVPELVFELAFEGVQASGRHKAGLALRFPRMVRWRRDKPAAEADRLESLRAMIDAR